jgi:hypothetical protein
VQFIITGVCYAWTAGDAICTVIIQCAYAGQVLKYMLAGRKVFSDSSCISLAIDASRVAKKKKLVGLVGSPNNKVMFAPPVARALVHLHVCVMGV